MNNNDKQNPEIQVLIVDDEVGFTHILSKRFSRRGIKPKIANSGAQAIQLLRKMDFHCAVLDLKMEDMNGIEVLKIFKKMDPDLPVIMLTGHGSETAAKEGMSQGAFDYLSKPCELEDLIKKIKQACEQA
ncbi:MAG: response regulator [Desulfobacterales bacterium]|nr:response regulator [Desulfobacterales bacterium]